MGSLQLNLADIPSNALSLGDHPAIIKQVTRAQAADGENFNLVWEVEITEGPDFGKTGRSWTSLKPTALWRLVDVMKTVGVLDPDATTGDLNIEWDDETGIVFVPELEGLPLVLRVTTDAKTKRQNLEFISITASAPAPVEKGGGKPRLR